MWNALKNLFSKQPTKEGAPLETPVVVAPTPLSKAPFVSVHKAPAAYRTQLTKAAPKSYVKTKARDNDDDDNASTSTATVVATSHVATHSYSSSCDSSSSSSDSSSSSCGDW